LSLGEGAGMVCLETLESARSRGATVLGELLGYGASTDVHHLTQPHPEGLAATLSMQRACDIAGVLPADIDYINAHGTGTSLNDSAEALAIRNWAGAEVAQRRVSSTKACIGHLLGAAGAVETVICLMCLHEQWIPPQPGEFNADPLCEFQIPRVPTDTKVERVLTNSFGFGGANASLVLRRAS
jgi:3-oxoacyl-[acyl-carrier-protein] synthase II